MHKRVQSALALLMGLTGVLLLPMACTPVAVPRGSETPPAILSPASPSAVATVPSSQSTPSTLAIGPTREPSLSSDSDREDLPTPVPADEGRSDLPTTGLRQRLLADLAPDAQAFLDGRQGKAGVAVIVPAYGAVYSANGDELMPIASVVKVVVMLTVMDQARAEGRALSGEELDLLHPMITSSDNDATTVLWQEVGGTAAIEDFLRSIGLADIVPDRIQTFGSSRASAKAVATLFAQIVFADILTADSREVAVRLLSGVEPDQRWGVTAGIPDDLSADTIIGLKNGWYPAEYSWRVNSAGIIVPGDDKPAYAIAVLTKGQPSWEHGIDTIEGVAERVHRSLHP